MEYEGRRGRQPVQVSPHAAGAPTNVRLSNTPAPASNAATALSSATSLNGNQGNEGSGNSAGEEFTAAYAANPAPVHYSLARLGRVGWVGVRGRRWGSATRRTPALLNRHDA